VHSGQPKPNQRRRRKALSGLGGLLETVGLEVVAEGVRAVTHSESWRERVSDCGSCDAETVDADKRDGVYA